MTKEANEKKRTMTNKDKVVNWQRPKQKVQWQSIEPPTHGLGAEHFDHCTNCSKGGINGPINILAFYILEQATDLILGIGRGLVVKQDLHSVQLAPEAGMVQGGQVILVGEIAMVVHLKRGMK